MSAEPQVDEAVPKLPRGRGLRLSGPELFRILLAVVTLVGVLLLARPCANAVSNFVMDMDGSASGGGGTAKPATTPAAPSGSAPSGSALPGSATPGSATEFEQLKPDMTEDEIKAAIERAKARNAGSAAP